MIIHCTQKLAAKLREVSTAPLAETSPLGSWHAHLYTIDHRQCVLFCHDDTRYVLFIAGLRAPQFNELGRLHRELFLATLAAQRVSETNLKRVALSLGPTRFDRAVDRSVLGSMNIVRSDLDAMLIQVTNVMELDPVKLSLTINERPATVKGKWQWPDKAMLDRLNNLL